VLFYFFCHTDFTPELTLTQKLLLFSVARKLCFARL
jgi:hypothetical protein